MSRHRALPGSTAAAAAGIGGAMADARFAFTIAATDGRARTGTIRMHRGEVRTPAFMPVGTAATVKAMKPADVRAAGADIILGNTYHLMLRPGAERIARQHQPSRLRIVDRDGVVVPAFGFGQAEREVASAAQSAGSDARPAPQRRGLRSRRANHYPPGDQGLRSRRKPAQRVRTSHPRLRRIMG